MSFPPRVESGELHLRQGDLDTATLTNSDQSSRVQYGPDNRKIPPEPLRPHDDVTTVAVPSTSDLFASAVGAVQHTLKSPDGSVMHGIMVGFTPPSWWGPASRYDVYASDESDLPAACFVRIGAIPVDRIGKGQDHHVYDVFLVAGRTYTIAVVPVNADGAGIEPEAAPQVTGVSLGGTGEVPPDVTNFDAVPSCCDLSFTWTAVATTSKDVAFYEIRQGASYAGGSFVLRAWGWDQQQAVLPHALLPLSTDGAPGNQFHIKAVTRLGAESATEGSHTLSAVESACLARCDCDLDPVLAEGYVGNLGVVAINALTPTRTDVYVLTDAGVLTLGSVAVVDGSVVQFDSTIWVEVIAGSGGFVPTGTNLITSQITPLIAPLTVSVDEGKIEKFDGTSLTAAVDLTPLDGDHVTVRGVGALQRNELLVLRGDVPTGTWESGAGLFSLTEIITDTLAADTDDYAPSGFSRAEAVRITLSGSNINITGLAGGIQGRAVLLQNVDTANFFRIMNQDGASLAVNQFNNPNGANLRVRPGGSAWVLYNSTSRFWEPAAAATG